MDNGRTIHEGRGDAVDYSQAEYDQGQRRKRALLIAAIVLTILVLFGAYTAFRQSGGGDQAGAGGAGSTAQASGPTVTVQIAQPQSVATIIATNGSIAARREMPVGVAGEGGQIAKVLVEPGQWVKQGQTLAVIDRSVQEEQVASLQANIRVAQADAELAKSELARAEALVSRGFISKADMDRKRATRDMAEARVRVAQAQYREAVERNGRLNITAPAAGLVLSREVEPGQIVGAGSGVLFRLAREGQMEMLAQVSEADLQRVNVGASATISPTGTDLNLAGQVWQIAPIVDPQSRQGRVRIAVPYHAALRPGGFADARLTVGAGQAPLLPESAVQSSETGNYVLIVDDQNIVRRRNIMVGTVTDHGVAIASGLNGGEKVVVLAGAFLNVGDRVKPVVAKAE